MSLKTRILNPATVKKETVTVPEWDNVTVELRSIRGRTRAKLLDAMAALPKTDTEEEANLQRGRAVLGVLPDFLIDGVFDPGTGERVFDEADRGAVEDLDEAVMQRLGFRILALSGLGGAVKDEDGKTLVPDAVDAAGKSSSSTPSGDSTSTSPSA